MQRPSDFRIVRFLIAAGRVSVTEVSLAVEAGNKIGLMPCEALVNHAFIQEKEMNLAIEAVQAIDGGMKNVLALVLFESACHNNTTFQQAATNASRRVLLGELLLKAKFINEAQLDAAIRLGFGRHVFIGEGLIRIKAITDLVLEKSLECQALLNAGELTLAQAIFVLHYALNFQVSCRTAMENFRLSAMSEHIGVAV